MMEKAPRHGGTEARRSGAAIVALLLLAGCGQPPGEIFGTADPALAWPPPPDRPRIRHVGIIETDADLRPGRSFFDGIGATLFGAEDERSMLSPYALCTDDDGRLLVGDSNGQCVHMFDLERRVYERWDGTGGDGAAAGPGFAQPVGVAVDGRGRVLVSDSVAGAIVVLDAAGRPLGRLGAAHLERPCGLAVDRAGDRILVADAAAHQVVALSPDGDLLARVGTRGRGPGQFNFPTHVAIDGAGRILVSDSLNFRVQILDRDLSFVAAFGSKGDMPGYFAQPKGIATDRHGHVYVVDANFESVQIFDGRGTLLLTFGQEGRAPGAFWLPAGIHVDANDRIWIADTYNRRVQVFEHLPEEMDR